MGRKMKTDCFLNSLSVLLKPLNPTADPGRENKLEMPGLGPQILKDLLGLG